MPTRVETTDGPSKDYQHCGSDTCPPVHAKLEGQRKTYDSGPETVCSSWQVYLLPEVVDAQHVVHMRQIMTKMKEEESKSKK
jgi:hypothetical protein